MFADVVQATSGAIYGTPLARGINKPTCIGGCGTIFRLSAGLKPFIETVPAGGKVGATILILGNDLTGATSVSFNGTAATFTVEPATLISTTVPTGATTGTVEVVTPTGTLKSIVKFRVRP
jgi:hypothetical protein